MFDFQLTPNDYTAQLQGMNMPTMAPVQPDWMALLSNPQVMQLAKGLAQQGAPQQSPLPMAPMTPQRSFDRGAYVPQRSSVHRRGLLDRG